MDRVAWWATVHVVTRVRQDLETKQQQEFMQPVLFVEFTI